MALAAWGCPCSLRPTLPIRSRSPIPGRDRRRSCAIPHISRWMTANVGAAQRNLKVVSIQHFVMARLSTQNIDQFSILPLAHDHSNLAKGRGRSNCTVSRVRMRMHFEKSFDSVSSICGGCGKEEDGRVASSRECTSAVCACICIYFFFGFAPAPAATAAALFDAPLSFLLLSVCFRACACAACGLYA